MSLALFPDCPSHEVKVKSMFGEFDVRKTQTIDIEGMIAVFNRLNIGFSTATVNDLFEKADANADGFISLQEFRRFGERYPTLLDCLYYRAKDYWTDMAQKESIDETRRMLETLREKEALAKAMYEQAKHETAEAERMLQIQMQVLAEAQRREADAKSACDAAHDATERARGELRDRVAELNAAKDVERQRQTELLERQRLLEAAIRRLQLQETEVTKAQEKLRDIERLLAEQHREVERQIAGAERCRAEAEAEEEREREAHALAAEALKIVHGCADNVAQAEATVAAAAEQEKAAARALRDAADETARQIAAREAKQKALAAAKHAESQRMAEAAAATEAVQEHEHLLQQMIQENQDFVEKRRQVDEEEYPLVDQEVRLREQRENLEKKEDRLRNDFTAFAGRHSTRLDSPRGPSSRAGSLTRNPNDPPVSPRPITAGSPYETGITGVSGYMQETKISTTDYRASRRMSTDVCLG